MKPKIIRTEEEYQAALTYIETLMDAAPGSVEEEELELYSLLVEKYEQEHFPIEMPDPVEAILFRMDQLGLTRQDIEQYIGSQSKVSEVLNHKRQLSLAMIRALHEGLDIPVEILVREAPVRAAKKQIKKRDYPFAEMFKRNYFTGFTGTPAQARLHKTELISTLVSKIHDGQQKPALCRNSEKLVNEYALEAWQARAMELADEQSIGIFERSRLTEEFLRRIIHLSVRPIGPIAVRTQLQNLGIAFIILPHLPQTYLDGACFMTPSGRPVIGMTLRHDRLDNFWFTLAHELAHLYLHLDIKKAFFDDLDHQVTPDCTQVEQEADQFASDLLIPDNTWRAEGNAIMSDYSETVILSFADRLNIHPVIVAGRIRWETNNYSLFADLIKKETVKYLFDEADRAR